MPESATAHWKWADVAKGIAIILVVVNHVGEGLVLSGLGTHTQGWVTFHDFCYTFMVPLFFVFSGWFAQISRKSPGQKAWSLLSNLVYPYVLWTILQTALMIVTKAGNHVPQWGDLPGILLDGWLHFWFLHCLIMLMVIDLVFRKFNIPPEIRLGIAILLVSVEIFGIALPWKLHEVTEYMIYFESGVFIAALKLPGVTRLRSLLFMAFAGIVLLVAFQLNGAGYPTTLRPVGAFAGIVACGAVSRLIAWRDNPAARFLEFCGKYSLQIYVLHGIFGAAIRVVLGRLGVSSFAVFVLLGSLAAFFGSLLLAYLDLRFFHVLFRFQRRPAKLPATAAG